MDRQQIFAECVRIMVSANEPSWEINLPNYLTSYKRALERCLSASLTMAQAARIIEEAAKYDR